MNPFRTVFPDVFTGEENIDGLLERIDVIKLVGNSARNRFVVILSSPKVVPYEWSNKIKAALKNALGGNKVENISVRYRFNLPAQTTPEEFFAEYSDVMKQELFEHHRVLFELYKSTVFDFSNPDEVKLVINSADFQDSFIADLIQIVNNVFKIIANMDVAVTYEVVAKSGMSDEQDEEKAAMVRRMVEKILTERDEKAKFEAQEAEKRKVAEEKEKNKFKYAKARNRVNEPGSELFYGRDLDGNSVDMEYLVNAIGSMVTVKGEIIQIEDKDTRNGKKIITFDVTDYTDTITCKFFESAEEGKKLMDILAVGKGIKLKGKLEEDEFAKEVVIKDIVGAKIIPLTKTYRHDDSVNKRVELHCHTKMTDMDGVADIKDLIDTAIRFGHKAIAFTDNGVVQAYTEAFHIVRDMKKAAKKKEEEFNFKIIYGLEADMVDNVRNMVTDPKGQPLDDTVYVVFDIETTGFSPARDRIIEIGAVKMQNGKTLGEFSQLINPRMPIPLNIQELTHITDEMVADMPSIEEVLPKFRAFCEGCVLVAHNADFDTSFIHRKAAEQGIDWEFTYMDTMVMAMHLVPAMKKFGLDPLVKHFKVVLDGHHRAVNDADATAQCFVKIMDIVKEMGITDLNGLAEYGRTNKTGICKQFAKPISMLIMNETGRVNLYRMVSNAHLNYFHKSAKFPKTDIMEHREGILLGSGGYGGELFEALLRNLPDSKLEEIVSFYDYLEILPLGNSSNYIKYGRNALNSVEELKEINKKIYELGRRCNKIVVATSDVHFVDPEDEIYRKILLTGKGGDHTREICDALYYRNTEEMLSEYSYFDPETAREIVIDNTNKICDMIEDIEPVRPDKCPPVIPHSDEDLRTICYNRAHEIYGPILPKVVSERLERELNSIISNGYSVMYIIAQKLVWKSNEDGYLVGSRGSVGSSFAATMAGITEVNPLSPHYYCTECHYSEFDSPEVLAYSGSAGCDMPDKICPQCGAMLKKDGYDIPFETFLGFKGDKEPDIDLNFSSEYQTKAHAYTEVIFGKGQTYKAGTIGTLQDKKAYGYIQNYYREMGVEKRKCEINRMIPGLLGIRATTGQHPGGIVVLPYGQEMDSFTPRQHPADDPESDIVTTHFEYHSIDHNLLKLDILGHDDPTMIRMLQDITGISPMSIPFDDQKVMSLFQNTSALGITPEDIGGTKLGALGIPEFGTDFAMGMLIETKPKAFSDLARIAGLSHGTDVWLNNTQDLIRNGITDLSNAICCRDDIMVYLMHMGLDADVAFKIMENVRKGVVAKGKCDKWDEWKADMLAHKVPQWYIGSCQKIKYMFPKAHAVAYVMMAWRIAYFKVYQPLAYYASFFSLRSKAFSYELMCFGPEILAKHLKQLRNPEGGRSLENKEEDRLRDMRIVEEMYARGFRFVPIDIYKAKATRFQVIDDKTIMPSFNSIDGIGDNVAMQIEEAAKGGAYISRDEFKQRAHVGDSVTNLLKDLGILEGIPESNQMSIFDYV